jgi:predicted ATP-dependent serine protease
VAGRLSRLGVKRADFHVVGQGAVDELVGLCRSAGARAAVIDSVNVSTLQPPDLRQFLESAGLAALLFVLQVTKDGRAAGSNAFLHEADVVARVAAGEVEVSKSRYQATPVSFDA